MDSNSLTLVNLVDAVSCSWGGNALIAAGYWSISIGVWAVGIRSGNIGSNRWLSISFTLSNVVSSITIGSGVTITIGIVAITKGIVAIVVVAIAIARLSIED